MLSLIYLEDEEKINGLQNRLYGKKINGATVGLMADEELCGIATFTIDECAHIKAVAVEEKNRKKGYGDFITRSLMNMLTLSGLDVAVDYEDKGHYFDKFKFKNSDGKLIVKADEIIFPSKCHKE